MAQSSTMTTSSPPAPLISLPNELILHIAECLDSPSSVSSLILTTHRLCILLTPLLHKHATQPHGRLTALQWAIVKGYYPLAQLLLSGGADPNLPPLPTAPNPPALHYAVQYANLPLVALLINYGANTNATDILLNTALLISLSSGHMDFPRQEMLPIIQMLLEHGANPALKNTSGQTPLHLAIFPDDGNVAIIKLLLKWGAPVNAANSQGMTPLQYAAKRGAMMSMLALLEVGADIEARDTWGSTPLYAAALRGKTDIMKVLIERGADVSCLEVDGQKVEDWF